MTCSLPPELLSAYLDGEVSSEERVRVELALASEPDCTRQLEALRQMQEALRQLPLPPLPPHFQATLRDRLFRYAPLVAARSAPARAVGRGWQVALAAVAAFFLLLAGAGGGILAWSSWHPEPAKELHAEAEVAAEDVKPLSVDEGASSEARAEGDQPPDKEATVASRAAASPAAALQGAGEAPLLFPTDPPRYQRLVWVTVTSADVESSLAGTLKAAARFGARLVEGKASEEGGARLRLQVSSALVDDLVATLADQGHLKELKVEAIPLDEELRQAERAWKALLQGEPAAPSEAEREALEEKRVQLWQAAQWAQVEVTFLSDR